MAKTGLIGSSAGCAGRLSSSGLEPVRLRRKVDPLKCPECGGKMAVISFIEKRDQADVIEKILKHCGLWDRPASRAPPRVAGPPAQTVPDLSYGDIDEFLMAL